jgi:type IV secretion system protein VirB10
VTSDVYSTNGKMVLIDRGSRLVGQYKGGLTKGQARVFVVWERVETPEGVLVELDSPGADSLGRAGLEGRIDRHFWQRFGGAMLVSIIGDVGQYVANKGSSGNRGDTIQFGGTQTAGEQAATTVLEHQIDIPPTLNKNQGDNISVFVARDLDFSSVYDLRVKR